MCKDVSVSNLYTTLSFTYIAHRTCYCQPVFASALCSPFSPTFLVLKAHKCVPNAWGISPFGCVQKVWLSANLLTCVLYKTQVLNGVCLLHPDICVCRICHFIVFIIMCSILTSKKVFVIKHRLMFISYDHLLFAQNLLTFRLTSFPKARLLRINFSKYAFHVHGNYNIVHWVIFTYR